MSRIKKLYIDRGHLYNRMNKLTIIIIIINVIRWGNLMIRKISSLIVGVPMHYQCCSKSPCGRRRDVRRTLGTVKLNWSVYV